MTPRRSNHIRAQRGVTLLELLVALSLFALLGVAAFRLLDAVATSEERLAEHSAQLGALQKALWQMQRDLEQPMPRPVRTASGSERPALVVGEGAPAIELTVGGIANPLALPRPSMRRVAYSVGLHPEHEDPGSRWFEDTTRYLLRWQWPLPDGSGARETALVQALLPDIEALEVEVLTDGRKWARWPPQNRKGAAPQLQALQVTLLFSDGSRIDRRVRIY